MESVELGKNTERPKPVVFVDAGFAKSVPREFMDDPFGYFVREGENIKAGEVVVDELGNVREDPTATKDLPSWIDEEGREVKIVGKKVNLSKGQIHRTNDPLHEFRVLTIVQENGLPGARPLARAESGEDHLIVMERVPGFRVNAQTVDLLKKEHGFSADDIKELGRQVEDIMEDLKIKFEKAGIIRKWDLKDMVLEIDLKNKRVTSVTPVDWERTKIVARQGADREPLNEQWELSSMLEDTESTLEKLWSEAKERGWSEEEAHDFVEVAFREALANAIIHGNLGLEKTPEIEESTWVQLVRETAMASDKKVMVDVEVSTNEIRISIKDEGKGFESEQVANPTAEGLMRNSGRGLLLIRAYSDEMELSEGGTRITLVKRRNV